MTNQTTTSQPTFWAAVDLAKAGYPVFPVRDKVPSVEGGFYAATTDTSRIAEWITEGRGDHDIAFATGLPSTVVVIDADSPKAYAKMHARYGEPHVKTKRGGHWYFSHPQDGKVTSVKIDDDLDRKADGGYVLVPPSRNRTWTNGIPDRMSLPKLPDELRVEIKGKSAERNGAAPPAAEVIPAGTRNGTLASLAGTMRRRGMGEAEITAALLETNRLRCDPPLKESEVRRIADSVAKYPPEAASIDAGIDVSDVSDVFSDKDNSIRSPEFPVDALPEGCRDYVKEAAASLLCPPELVGLPVLCALSAVIGHSRALRIKPGWTVSASLYAAVVDTPGSRKSPAAAFAYKPLEKLQVQLRKDYKEEKKIYDLDLRQHAVDKKLASKNDKPEPDPPVKPTMRRCIVDDITVEALAKRLEENPRGFLSAHDELTGFLRGLDQYKSGGKGNARQTYLKMWSNQAIIVDRKGSDEPVVVPSPYVTLQGAIQPGVLDEIGAGRDDGFLDRFLFCYPDSQQGGYSDSYISAISETKYARTINALWNKSPFAEDEEKYDPQVVQMSEEAKALFKAEANKLREEMYAPGFPEMMRGAWAKFDLHLARLALILTVARQADSEREEVSEEDMRNALRLLGYFKHAARRVYGQLFEANPDDVLASDLLTFLTKTRYVFSGTISQLLESLESDALPSNEKSMGRALRRIARATPELTLSSRSDGKHRIITLHLEKTSETSKRQARRGGGGE